VKGLSVFFADTEHELVFESGSKCGTRCSKHTWGKGVQIKPCACLGNRHGADASGRERAGVPVTWKARQSA
jgi:hypothetical protein